MGELQPDAGVFGTHNVTRYLPQDETVAQVTGDAPGLHAGPTLLPPAWLLRRGLGEHGSKATIDELRGYASYLVTGGARGYGRPAVVTSHDIL